MKERPRHIPDFVRPGFTFCGRAVVGLRLLDVQREWIDDAECRACQRSDDRRTRELSREERAFADRLDETRGGAN